MEHFFRHEVHIGSRQLVTKQLQCWVDGFEHQDQLQKRTDFQTWIDQRVQKHIGTCATLQQHTSSVLLDKTRNRGADESDFAMPHQTYCATP